jgi:hypothetical protein
MARYIDVEKLIEYIDKNVVCTSDDSEECKQFMLEHLAMEWFAPTADVAPRAEVAKIFEEIESEIVAALQSNYRAKQERVEKQSPDNFVSYMCEGKIAALRGIEAFVEELKNKYAEVQK